MQNLEFLVGHLSTFSDWKLNKQLLNNFEKVYKKRLFCPYDRKIFFYVVVLSFSLVRSRSSLFIVLKKNLPIVFEKVIFYLVFKKSWKIRNF